MRKILAATTGIWTLLLAVLLLNVWACSRAGQKAATAEADAAQVVSQSAEEKTGGHAAPKTPTTTTEEADKPATYSTEVRPAEVQNPSPRLGNRRPPNWQDYLPDSLHLRAQPYRRVQLAIHYMNTADSFYTDYLGDAGLEYAKELVYYMNKKLDANEPYTLDPDLPVYDPRWRFELGRKPGSEERAVYHHFSDQDYAYLHAGPQQNRGHTGVTKYKEGLDSLLNIFVMAPPRDSMASPTFKPEDPLGVYMRGLIKVTGFYPRRQPWSHASNLNHEAAHAFGLPHAWMRRDGCDDTVAHPNDCWSPSEAGCQGKTSNNMMDYNVYQVALTPCQIGRVAQRLAGIDSPLRRWVKPIWCSYNSGYRVRINEDTEWRGERDLYADVIVASGVRLEVNGRLHFPAGARLIVEPGATLVLGPEARLHNACNQRWGGIELPNQSSNSARLLVDPMARIENTGP